MSCACLFGSSALVVFCFSPSLLPVLLPSSCGSFLLGGPFSSSSVGGFDPSTFFVLLWFSLRLFSLVCCLLSSRFPLLSSGSSLVLFGSPFLPSFSFLFLPWLSSFSLHQFSLACAGVLLSPLRWFLSCHLGFLFFLMSFSVSVSCPPWDSSWCYSSSTSFVTRSHLSSFATGSSLWAESSLLVVAVVASLSVSSLGRLSPFVLGPRLCWLLPPWFPVLLELLVTVPVFLSNQKVLLCQLSFHGFLQILHVLRLSA